MALPPLRQFSRQEFAAKFKQVSWQVQGKVSDVIGGVIEARLSPSPLGTITNIEVKGRKEPILAEVVGFRGPKTLLLPYSELAGISPGSLIREQDFYAFIPAGDFLLGQVIDPFLTALKGPPLLRPQACETVPLDRPAPNPLSRQRIAQPLSLGIRALDGLLTFGEGQRIGIMAGSGVGKSVLMGMIARGSASDVNVIGLIGERGREVREFIEKELGDSGLKKSVVIAVTSDQSPLMRLRGAKVTTAIAEYFSSQGARVLLMMDSLTRVAQAQREIGLAVGEAPTTKAYTPSVFSLLPRLLERCGPQAEGKGSISGLYTTLVDGDDFNDPLPDAVRSILDGHINLSRSLANKGHFPAIEVTSSVSRVMPDIVSPQQLQLAALVKSLVAIYEENYDFVQMGTYQGGVNPQLDAALQLMPQIQEYLSQPMHYLSSMEEAIQGLVKIAHNYRHIQQGAR